MTTNDLFEQINLKRSMLCVGLDTSFDKLPLNIQNLALKGSTNVADFEFTGKMRSLVDFNKAIVDATAPYCVAFKPNLAFYESYGYEGMKVLEATVSYIRKKYPEQFIIADAKRGDIGNTAKMYAKTYFEAMDFDAVTISP